MERISVAVQIAFPLAKEPLKFEKRFWTSVKLSAKSFVASDSLVRVKWIIIQCCNTENITNSHCQNKCYGPLLGEHLRIAAEDFRETFGKLRSSSTRGAFFPL